MSSQIPSPVDRLIKNMYTLPLSCLFNLWVTSVRFGQIRRQSLPRGTQVGARRHDLATSSALVIGLIVIERRLLTVVTPLISLAWPERWFEWIQINSRYEGAEFRKWWLTRLSSHMYAT